MNIFTIFAPIIDFVLRFFLKKRNRPRLERPVPTSFLYTKKGRMNLICKMVFGNPLRLSV